jgi:hypothetical protein
MKQARPADVRRNFRILLWSLMAGLIGVSLNSASLGRWLSTWAQDQPPPEIATITPTFTPEVQSPLATIEVTKVIRLANEINHPKDGDAIAGFTQLIGYASAPSFRRYEVHIAVASSESWQWLFSNNLPVYDDLLYMLDTTKFPDGRYDLRVRVIRDDGNYSEAFLRRVEVRNANPPTATIVRNALGTPFATPTPTPVTPTLTPTPEFISHIPDGQGIFLPYTNGVLRGLVKVIGTVNAKPNTVYIRYELAIVPVGSDNWTLLVSSNDQIWQDVIYKLDTRKFPDGLYDLRLRIVYDDGNYNEFQVRNLYIANLTPVNIATATPTPPTRGIFIPRSGDLISGTLSITGTANMLNFQRWELAWSTSGAEAWIDLVISLTPVTNDLIARLDLTLLPPGDYDLRLRIYNWNNQFEEYVVRRLKIAAPTPTPTFTPFP